MHDDLTELVSAPTGTVRNDSHGVPRTKAASGLWYRTRDAGKPGRTGLTSAQMRCLSPTHVPLPDDTFATLRALAAAEHVAPEEMAALAINQYAHERAYWQGVAA